MKSILLAVLGAGMYYSQGASIIKWLDVIGQMNYLTLVLIGYGLFALRHLGRVYLFGEGELLSAGFVGKSFWILGLSLGVPMYMQHLLQ